MATYDIPTITGYTTVNAASKSDALSQVPNASLVKPVVAGGAITPQYEQHFVSIIFEPYAR